MDPVKRAEELRTSILKQVGEYYALTHGAPAPFVPGETRINYAGRVFDQQEMINAVDSALEFWLSWGRYSREFEQRLADYLGVRKAFLVNSGSSANLLAFMALTSPLLGERRIRRGDEVITVAAGFPTTVAPMVQFGAVPVFIDVDAGGNLNPELLEAALSPRTRAVMAAHSLGNPFDLDRVVEFCRRHELFLVEDNCDALGSLYHGRRTGTFGQLGTSSFYPPHHLTMGEGGAVYTDDPLLARILLSLRDWGRDCYCNPGVDNTCGCRFSGRFGTLPPGYDHKYVYRHFGYNLKISDLQAAIGCAQLDKLPGFVAARRRNFELLRQGLADCADLLQLPEPTPGAEPSWFGFLLTRQPGAPFSRNDFARYLEDHRIQTRNLFAGNLTRHPCCETLREGVDYRISGVLEATDRIMNDSLWIGLYPGMDQARIDYQISVIREFIQAQRARVTGK